jgi:hypothetical protein
LACCRPGMATDVTPTGDAGANETPKPLLARCPAAEVQRPGKYPSLSAGPPRNGNRALNGYVMALVPP